MPRPKAIDKEKHLTELMGEFFEDALGFVMYNYPWKTYAPIQVCELPEEYRARFPGFEYGPDRWACEFLDSISEQVRQNKFDGRTAVPPIREGVSSGHGIGKSAMAGWLVDWIMSTRPHSQGTVTANTGPQLETKTWAQIAKWTRLCFTGHWFNVNTGRGSMKMSHKQFPETWFCSAQTCREENSESFAGQHAATATSFYLVDESSGVPDKIYEVMQGGLTDGEPMIFAFGNPTRNTGWFRDVAREGTRWGFRQIDSRNVQISNKALIEEWRQDHGEDSDFFKVRVRGVFPSQSVMQFISGEDVAAAMKVQLRPDQYENEPVVLGVDPAWTGDDKFVIAKRQGLKYDILAEFDKNDNDYEMAMHIARLEDEHKADGVFVDAGYGTGIVSAGRSMGREWLLVWFGSTKVYDPGYANRRAEIWGALKDNIMAGAQLPSDKPRLIMDLTSVETAPRDDGRILLESKNSMRKRGLDSPDYADALAITHAYPVVKKAHRAGAMQIAHEYDPYVLRQDTDGVKTDYNPMEL